MPGRGLIIVNESVLGNREGILVLLDGDLGIALMAGWIQGGRDKCRRRKLICMGGRCLRIGAKMPS